MVKKELECRNEGELRGEHHRTTGSSRGLDIEESDHCGCVSLGEKVVRSVPGSQPTLTGLDPVHRLGLG